MNRLNHVQSILTNAKHTRWIAPCLILAEVVLCGLILWKVKYTEIDFVTYLQQAREFLEGERHYTQIKGASGPLVYPALHLYIYSIIYKLTATVVEIPLNIKNDRIAVDIALAQLIFAGLYILTLAVVIKCYRNVNAPPWLLAPLVLSKRLHSIFLLRLFNDGFAAFGFWLSILMFQQKRWMLGAVCWCLGLGVKMSVLLAAPAIGAILVQAVGLADSLFIAALCLVLQIIIAQPFLGSGLTWEYLSRAFEFGRVFLFKWTVNWRFVGEETFLSTEFAVSLMVLHVSLLVGFLHWKWLRPSSKGLPDFITKYLTRSINEQEANITAQKISPTFVMDTMLGSMIIGLLCARSLHYQFFAYLGWATPYILWRAAGNPVWVAINWVAQELCWLTFPSTDLSSAVVVFELALQTICGLISPPVDHISPRVVSRDKSKPVKDSKQTG